jgi:deoxyribodipyrimidine photolyase-related protein
MRNKNITNIDLSPLLNIGLLTDQDLLDEVLPLKSKIPINSFEGFLRQIIGWKQSMRYLYEFHFDKFNNKNFLHHNNKISRKFWDANTGIPPIDNCIKKIQDIGYLHHIERLMVMGQFFLLTMVKPDDVFDWYISLVSIDAYEWVMYPNIYGMIMYADGGYMMSRPYFSSSAYIKKMSNYKKNESVVKLKDGKEYKWYDIWDALYYNFIDKHYAILKKIYATARNTYHWDNKDKEEKNRLLKLAKLYLEYL